MRLGFILRWSLGVVVVALLGLGGGSAIAAEQIILKYSIFQESASVSELTTFAETGEASPSLQSLFRMANQDPEPVRRVLIQPIQADHVVLDRFLNSFVGKFILTQISQVIYTPAQVADEQALRSALVLSAAADGQISLLEVLQRYPTQQVEVDGDRLQGVYQQLKSLEEQLRNLRLYLP
ncbi:MAG: alpha/beta hydrolase [Leptolyngbyaceae bacterium]|nr:alpha/beta hydrolase [Leptolyngbyaceae bacterium]